MSVAKERSLTQAQLKELLHYNPETGKFVWKVQSGRQAAGTEAGAYSEKLGYWLIGVKGVRHYAHRLAWLYMTGEWPKGVIDHDDNDGSNNRFVNLKDVPQKANIQKAVRSGGYFGVPGVGRYSEKQRKVMVKHFYARIVEDGITFGLGSFSTVKEAYEEYRKAKKERHGLILPEFETYGVENVRSERNT